MIGPVQADNYFQHIVQLQLKLNLKIKAKEPLLGR